MRDSLKIGLCCIFSFMLCSSIKGQDIKVRGAFLADSVRVGDEIFFSLSALYPKDQQIIFPDSAYRYGSFEFIKKRYFITETNNGISYDSAVYHLTTYETDPIQRLRLSVYKVNALDCTRYFTKWDTVKMELFVKILPEKIGADLPVRATIAYQPVAKSFNYPLIAVIASLALLLAGVIWFVFGDTVNQYFVVKKMKRAHLLFVNSYDAEIQKVKDEFSTDGTEKALSVWKKYMENLNKKPYTKLTTRETLFIDKDENLAHNLRIIDAAIYGSNKKVMDSLMMLRVFADSRFNQKLKEVKNER